MKLIVQAGNILNGAYNFLFSFTENGLKPGYIDDLDETYKDEGSWKFIVEK